jgi:hypothetical protein
MHKVGGQIRETRVEDTEESVVLTMVRKTTMANLSVDKSRSYRQISQRTTCALSDVHREANEG